MSKDGKTLKVSEMTHSHLLNSIKLLERKKRCETAFATDKIFIVSHPKYANLVMEAIRRNLLGNPYNGVDINLPITECPQVRGVLTAKPLIPENDNKDLRKISFDL